jgi:hypothetical protein
LAAGFFAAVFAAGLALAAGFFAAVLEADLAAGFAAALAGAFFVVGSSVSFLEHRGTPRTGCPTEL